MFQGLIKIKQLPIQILADDVRARLVGKSYHKLSAHELGRIFLQRVGGFINKYVLYIDVLASGDLSRRCLMLKFSGLHHLRYNSFIYVLNKKQKNYFKLQVS